MSLVDLVFDLAPKDENPALRIIKMETQFQRLLEMSKDWDSYGADAPRPACVTKAHELWRALPDRDLWDVVPCSDGSVQIEQHRDGFDIEISVRPADSADANNGNSAP